MYALGRRGAIGALWGMHLPVQRRRLALFYLAVGVLHAFERFEDSDNIDHELFLNDAFSQEVSEVLVSHFALTEQESQILVKNIFDDYQNREQSGNYFEKVLTTDE